MLPNPEYVVRLTTRWSRPGQLRRRLIQQYPRAGRAAHLEAVRRPHDRSLLVMELEQLDLSFVDEPALQEALSQYLAQIGKAHAAGAYLGVIVACGAVLEGLLTWALTKKESDALSAGGAPKDRAGNSLPIREWGLAALIDVAVALGMIGKTAKDAAWAVKDFRNFIHPYNLLRQSARPNEVLAASSTAALSEIHRSLKGRLQT